MRTELPRNARQLFLAMSEQQQRRFIAGLSSRDLLELDAMFDIWSQEGQQPPSGAGWRVWLMMAGRGFGKTRAGAEWIVRLAMGIPKRRIALAGATLDEARSVMVEGRSGLLAICRRLRLKAKWEPGRGRISWPNGSVAEIHSGDSPDGFRGPEFHYAWADEIAKWRRGQEAWDNLQLGLRLGPRPRALLTTTPKPGPLLDAIRRLPDMVETGGKTDENFSLSELHIDAMRQSFGGTRLGRQELDGELMSEAEGALFPRALLEQARITDVPGRFERIVVGVDPPAGTEGDGCGIVVAGREGGRIIVLADASVSAGRPERWARVAAAAAEQWGASHIVAEANQGGAMVESVLKAAGVSVPVKLVHASRGKVARAEPVAVRFETGRGFLGGVFPELEAELAGLQAGGGYAGRGRSPDRADAMVWAVTELSETTSGLPRVRWL